MRAPEDGKIYYLPNFGIIQGEEAITEHWGTGVLSRSTYGRCWLPTITTLDEFVELIANYVEKYP